MRIAIVGGEGGTKIGDSLRRAALRLGHGVELADSDRAFAGPSWLRRISWHLLGHRPPRLDAFGEAVLRSLRGARCDVLVATGLAPLSRRVLDAIGRLGVVRINYLTDDPWNPAHRAGWFLEALPGYDLVVSPRRSVIGQLGAAGCGRVEYVPFGYDEDLFRAPAPEELREFRASYGSELCFAGGADADRVPYIAALAGAGVDVALYGSYWERYAPTRHLGRGQVPPEVLRKVLCGTKVGLCLVRRANRDGNSMRTFELAALGTAMLAERTDEHEELFGRDGQSVAFFGSIEEMLERARWLLANASKREQLARRAFELVTQGGHSYRHRLSQILALAHG